MDAVSYFDSIVSRAHEANASDIHIDPEHDHSTIRLRVDGILLLHEKLPKHFHADLIGRIKILSSLRTDEHMAPQDGRCRVELLENQHVDIRISIIPSYFGESAVLRLLCDTSHAPALASLGMSESDQNKIHKILSQSSGMILVTGPTGSGKTTTLYTILKMLNDGRQSLITIEDPIEYALPGVRQIQVKQESNLTFASGLRSIIRQDPDVIMVGEIRDSETASIAIHAALTGHLLLSTLHTNDAAGAVVRLMDMGIDPYLIASTIGIVIGQRLVRVKCPQCEQGCTACKGEGSRGRTGIYEILTGSEVIREAIMKRASSQTIRSLAIKHGMRTMEDDGLEKSELGITRVEEVISATSQEK